MSGTQEWGARTGGAVSNLRRALPRVQVRIGNQRALFMLNPSEPQEIQLPFDLSKQLKVSE